MLLNVLICVSDQFLMHQVLVYDDIPETELIWVTAEPGQVPDGAVVAGQISNGDLLNVAMANNKAGHYDINKDCADYFRLNGDLCVAPYWILTVKHNEFWREALLTKIWEKLLQGHVYYIVAPTTQNHLSEFHNSRVSCQKGPICHA